MTRRQAVGEMETPSWIIDINRRLNLDYHVHEYNNNTYVDDGGGTLAPFGNCDDVRLERIQKDAFLPELVFIGPYTDELKDRYQEVEQHKERLLVRLLKRGRLTAGFSLEDLVNAMKLLEVKTRACYSQYLHIDKYTLTSNNFVKMMVIDGCFVIEVLRLNWQLRHSSKSGVDPIFRSSSTTIHKLQRDFLKLRNQFPFSVLKELYLLTSDDNTREPPLRCLAIDFLKELAGEDEEDAGISLLEDDPRADHCNHLLHLFSYACTNKPQRRYLSLQDIVLERLQEKVVLPRARKLTYNAKELQEAGVKIKPKQHTQGGGLMAIDTFKGTTLRIQPFYLDNNVVFMLLNFLAFEQCKSEANPYFTSYIMFLDCLIDSEADIEILHKAGILNHAFGNNKDVANLIYKVTRELNDPDYNHFHREMMELNSYCKEYYGSKWRPWWRNLRNNHFSSPWTITSLVAATILLILTFIQTFYTTYAYYKPPN